MKKKYEELVMKLTKKYPERQKEFITGSLEKVIKIIENNKKNINL